MSHPEMVEIVNTLIYETMTMNRNMKPIIAMCNDGTKFDSSQHTYIKKFIDNNVSHKAQLKGKWSDDKYSEFCRQHSDSIFEMTRQQRAKVTLLGEKKQRLASWTVDGTTFSGETSTTVCNTLRSILYGAYAIYSCGMNVTGMTPLHADGHYIGLVCKGDDQLFLGTVEDLEHLAAKGFPQVYRESVESPPNVFNQFTEGVTYQWGFLSTAGMIVDSTLLFMTRHYMRYALSSRSVAKRLNPTLVAKYGLSTIIAARMYMDYCVMKAITNSSIVYEAISDSLLSTIKSMTDVDEHALEALFPKLRTQEDFYATLLANPKVAQQVTLDSDMLEPSELQQLVDLL